MTWAELRPVAAVLVMMLSGSIVAAGFLLLDRRLLDEHGRSRTWYPATLELAIASPALGLGIPAFFACFAHVLITRRGAWWSVLGKAIFAMVLAMAANIAVAQAGLWLLGLSDDVYR